MLNQVVVVGRLVDTPDVKETENGKAVSNITVAVPRSYKNENGEYETDFLDCTLWGDVAKTTYEYCKKGDLLGIKGRIQVRTIDDDEKSYKKTEIIAERITFLSSAKSKEHDNELD